MGTGTLKGKAKQSVPMAKLSKPSDLSTFVRVYRFGEPNEACSYARA
jgi:hypothetical protein